jgi:hypothetical protein
MNNSILEKKFFHSFHDGKINLQGQIISELNDNYFLIQLFEWVLGAESTKRIVHIDVMVDWNIYDTDKEMNDYYYKKNQI